LPGPYPSGHAGSSSVKFQVFAIDAGGTLARKIKGQMDGIGTRPRLRASRPDGNSRDQGALQIEALHEGRNGGDLVRFFIDRLLVCYRAVPLGASVGAGLPWPVVGGADVVVLLTP
jgi:hypothetical protein